MDKFEYIVKENSSKKLKEIVEHQSTVYRDKFIGFAKDELVKRDETFPFSPDLIKDVTALNDNDLKNLVEKEWNNYHIKIPLNCP